MPAARLVADAGAIATRVGELAQEIAAEPAGTPLVLVSVLRGSLVFAADLARRLPGSVRIDFLGLTSYASGGGRVRITRDLDLDVRGCRVMVLEDIVDTGLTLSFVLRHLAAHDPADLSVCALFDKVSHRLVPVPIDRHGFLIDEDFVVGYGLDYQGRYRNLADAVGVDPQVLVEDPDAYVDQLYGAPRAPWAAGRRDGRRDRRRDR